MMYTPMPSTRRPRPPSRSRTAQMSGKAQSTTNPNLNFRPPLLQNPSSSTVTSVDRPPSISTTLDRKREDLPRPEEYRVSIKPAEQNATVPDQGSCNGLRKANSHGSAGMNSKRRTLGLGLASPIIPISNTSSMEMAQVEPSPPPPYGTTMPSSSPHSGIQSAPTPLRQDSGTFSQQSSRSSRSSSNHTERSRIRRATDAARAMGLEVDYGTSGSESRGWVTEDAETVSAEAMRIRLVEMKRQLKRRDNELLLAAEVANKALRTHEDLLAYLPTRVKASLPESVHLFPSNHSLKHQHTRSPSTSSADSASRVSHGIRQPSSNFTSTMSAGPMTTSSTVYSSVFPDSAETCLRSDEQDVSDSLDDFATADDELGFEQHYSTIRGKAPLRRSNSLRSGPHPRAINRPGPGRRHISHRQAQFEELKRADADDKILALEQAVDDARESEENQRRLAARLRKEVEKLQRDFERSELERAQVEQALPVCTPGIRGTLAKTAKRSLPMIVSPLRAGSLPTRHAKGTEAGLSADSDELADQDEDEAEPDLGDVTDRFLRTTPGSRRSKHPSPALTANGSVRSIRPKEYSESVSSARATVVAVSPNHEYISSRNQPRRLRKKVSQSNFSNPHRFETLTLKAHQSLSPSPLDSRPNNETLRSDLRPPSLSSGITPVKSRNRSRAVRRSPWPQASQSPESHESSPNSQGTLDLPHDSFSPVLASLSSRMMMSMRTYVSSALQDTPTRPRPGRTLGSELGSDYEDEAESSLRIIEDALALVHPSPRRPVTESDDDGRSVFSDGFYEPPAPLPPRVSAALSSLALALAPYASPHPSRIDTSLPESSYSEGDESNDSDSVLAMRKIRWADTTKSSLESSAGSDEVVSDSVFVLPKRPTRSASAASSTGTAFGGRSISRPSRVSPRFRPRPTNARQSSDGSLSLAHRRRASQQAVPQSGAVGKAKAKIDNDDHEGAWEAVNEEDPRQVSDFREPRTIPGKVVHDLICLIAILVDFVECAVVIIYRVILDMRYGERPSMLGAARRANMRRYYL